MNHAMAYLIHFRPVSMSREQYDQIHEALGLQGLSDPSERLFHASFGPDSHLEVVDIWSSLEGFHSFGEVLMPIIESMGVQMGSPHVHQLNRVILSDGLLATP